MDVKNFTITDARPGVTFRADKRGKARRPTLPGLVLDAHEIRQFNGTG